jgi:hypothetical protein
LEIGYQFKAAVEADANAKASFIAKMELYRDKMVSIAQGLAQITILINGANGAEAPIVTLGNELNGLGEAALTGDFNVSAGLITCTLDAIAEVPGTISKATSDATAVIEGSVSLMAVIGQ